jgi:hypothetical protein
VIERFFDTLAPAASASVIEAVAVVPVAVPVIAPVL